MSHKYQGLIRLERNNLKWRTSQETFGKKLRRNRPLSQWNNFKHSGINKLFQAFLNAAG